MFFERFFFWCVVGAVWRLQRASTKRATDKRREESTRTTQMGFCLFVEYVCCFVIEHFWCCEAAAYCCSPVQDEMTTLQAQCMKNRPAEAHQVESDSGKPRGQHSSAKPPSTEESQASNGLHCVLAVLPEVRRELPGLRLLTKAWLLVRDSSVEWGLAALCWQRGFPESDST